MRTNLYRLLLSTLLAASFGAIAPAATAGTANLVGVITKIQLAPDGKSAQATLTDNKTSASVVIRITDDLTLDKFKDKRIVEGDEIRTKYDDTGGANVSKSFKKTAGC